jgi:bacterioferritin-associated ferredoxin
MEILAMARSATAHALRQPALANDLHSPPFSCYSEPFAIASVQFVYVCNCNGLRKRDVAAAIEAGAVRPRDVFARNQCTAQCAKCVCEMREMIQESRESFAMAAE